MSRDSARRLYPLVVTLATLFGLVVRLVFAFAVKGSDPLAGDAIYYHYQALYLTRGKFFVNPEVLLVHHPFTLDVHSPALASAAHPPLFTSVLAAGDLLGLGSVGAQKLLVVLVGTLSIVAVAALAREVAGPRAGAVAAVIAAAYPGMWVYDGQVLSEALLILLAALTLLAAYRCRRRPSWRRLALLGAGCSLCALDRPEMILLVPLVAVPVAWGWRGSDRSADPAAPAGSGAGPGLGQRLGRVAAVCAVSALVIAPWTIRNTVTFTHPVLLSDQLDMTLAAANNRDTYSGHFFGSWCFGCLLDGPVPKGDETVQAAYWKGVADRYVTHHLGRVPVVLAARVGITFGLYRPGSVAGASRVEGWPYPVTVAWFVWYYPLAVLGVAGAFVLRRRSSALYPLVALVLVAAAAVVVTYGNLRFRAEAEVALVVLGAVALDAAAGVFLHEGRSEPDAPAVSLR